jgi:hypothetical protein
VSQIIVNCSWHPYHYSLNLEEFDKNVEVYVDNMPTNNIPNNTIRIILIQESYDSLKNRMIEYFNQNKNCYIFTYHQDILDKFKNARLFIGSATRIHYYSFPKKEFSVSTLVGGKTSSEYEGYGLRHQIWERQNEIVNIPRKFYLSSHFRYNNADYKNNLIISDLKEPLFDSKFSITIENTSMFNMFSEKIIDCFQTKTIPIYYGCKNIGDFFNVDGIIIVNNIDDIIDVCNSLTDEIYESKLNAIEENYEKSLKYCYFDVNLKNKIIELLYDYGK